MRIKMKQGCKIDCGDFTITIREIIASVIITAAFVILGLMISSNIYESELDINEQYDKSIHIKDTEMFQHAMNTNLGNAFVYGELKVIDPVSMPEIEGQYAYIEKVEEHYNKHTRIVTKTKIVDGKEITYEEEEIYYTWDYYDSWEERCSQINFCGVDFPVSKIKLPTVYWIDTINESSKVRYVYYGIDTEFTGTIFAELKDKTIPDSTQFYDNKTIEETAYFLRTGGLNIIFWIFWIIVWGLCEYGFLYIDNNWLEG